MGYIWTVFSARGDTAKTDYVLEVASIAGL